MILGFGDIFRHNSKSMNHEEEKNDKLDLLVL